MPDDKLDALLGLMNSFQEALNDVRSEVRALGSHLNDIRGEVRTLGNHLEPIEERLTSLEQGREDTLTPEEEADIAYDEHAPIERPVTGSSAITGGPPMMKNQAGYRYFIR